VENTGNAPAFNINFDVPEGVEKAAASDRGSFLISGIKMLPNADPARLIFRELRAIREILEKRNGECHS
jgi:hypothetical protein